MYLNNVDTFVTFKIFNMTDVLRTSMGHSEDVRTYQQK